MRVLIAEDDVALAGFVRKGLEAEHYAVDISSDGEQACALASELDHELVVLDLHLPRLDGVAILKDVRGRKADLPILVLTGRGRVEDRILCLDIGADDSLVKPFSFSELSARIRALLRRNRLPSESVLKVEDLKLDWVERRVTRGTRAIDLTSKEFALLEYLMRNAGRFGIHPPLALILTCMFKANVLHVHVSRDARRSKDVGYFRERVLHWQNAFRPSMGFSFREVSRDPDPKIGGTAT